MIPISKKIVKKYKDEKSGVTYLFRYLTGELAVEYHALLSKINKDGSTGVTELFVWLIDNLLIGWESDSVELPEFCKKSSQMFLCQDIQGFGELFGELLPELSGAPVETAKN